MPIATSQPKTHAFRRHLPGVLAGLALAGCLGTAHATVTYSTGVLATQADIVRTTGAVIEANHLGTPGLPASSDVAVTVNGITFGTDTSHLGNFTRSGSDFYNFSNDAGLQTLLSGAYFQPGGGNSYLSLGGLTQGSTYTLQFLLSNSFNETGSSSWINLEGSTFNITPYYYHSLVHPWNAAAHYVRATFTASGTSELVTFGNGYAYESDRMQLNAYVLSEGTVAAVPEPESAAMLMAGLAALGLVTRRKKKASGRQA